MQKAIIAKKIGMTQLFDENGKLLPVTVLEAGPCLVTGKKTVEKDGYESVQLGYGELKEKHIRKPQKAAFDKAGLAYKKYLREFRLEDCSGYEIGAEVKCDVFQKGDYVDVTGTSKGKGFTGAIKRWGSHRGPMTHGSGYHRGVGSMGACSTPSRVMKGKKLAGHMGAVRVTVQNLYVAGVDTERNLILVKGAVPGPKGSLITIRDTVKK